MRVRERVRGREDARRQRRGRVTLDLKSLRARAPCQVRAVHRVGRPKDCRLREDMHDVHEEKGSGPMARGFPVVQSEWPGGGVFLDGQTCRDVLQDGGGRRTETGGNPGHGNGIRRRDGKENWMMLFVVGGVTCWTIKPKRAEELGPASLADLELATGTRPSWPHLQSPRSRGDGASSASDLYKRGRGHWPICKGDRHRLSHWRLDRTSHHQHHQNPVIQRSNKVGRPCGPAMAYTYSD